MATFDYKDQLPPNLKAPAWSPMWHTMLSRDGSGDVSKSTRWHLDRLPAGVKLTKPVLSRWVREGTGTSTYRLVRLILAAKISLITSGAFYSTYLHFHRLSRLLSHSIYIKRHP